MGFILGDGPVNATLIISKMPVQHGGIGLADMARLKLLADMGVDRLIQRHDQNPRGAKVQAMDHGGGGKVLDQTIVDRVPVERVFARQGQQHIGFIDQEQVGILIKHLYLLLADRDNKRIGLYLHTALSLKRMEDP